MLLSFPWSWSPATATPSSPLPSRKLGWGEASYVTACRRSRRRRGKDRESEISLTTQLRPQNRRRDTPILKNPQQWQPPRTSVSSSSSSSSSSSLFLPPPPSRLCLTFAQSAQSYFSVYKRRKEKFPAISRAVRCISLCVQLTLSRGGRRTPRNHHQWSK